MVVASFLSTRAKAKTHPIGCVFVLELPLADANRLCQRQSGSNLEAKRKRLSIVFATFLATKQGVDRAEQAQAKGYDYATGADN